MANDRISVEVAFTPQQFDEVGAIAEMEGFPNQRELIASWLRDKIKTYRDKVLRRDRDLADLQ